MYEIILIFSENQFILGRKVLNRRFLPVLRSHSLYDKLFYE